MRILIAMVVLALMGGAARAALHTETVTYQDGDAVLKGHLAYDESVEGKRPGALVVHEWYGLTKHPQESAQKLALLGYTALAVDMYGDGKVAKDTKEAAALAGNIKQHPELARSRFEAALETLRKHPTCDPDRVAAIGYCFGGTVVLEMARSGLDLAGVVSFHGGLTSAVPEAERTIKAKVLVCHGADDPHVPRDDVEAFEEEMRRAGADWQFISYGGAVHSFTNPDADSEGARYHPLAARRSWEAMRNFLREVFAEEG